MVQALYAARKMEMESEDHLKKMMTLEDGRIKQELQRIEHDMADLKERKNLYQVPRDHQGQNLHQVPGVIRAKICSRYRG